MRPRRLEATAFGPFAERIAVDFTRLPSDQPFLIGGPTGAGKTSLLDAVTYALYGELPGQRKKADGVRSHHAAEDVDCRVSLEFEVGSEVYRITRTPSRTVSGRKTPVPATARLERLTGDSFQPVETKLSEVRESVRSAIGLSAEQFQRVVLLPQGEFAKMLHAPTTERAPLLRSLFGTSMYRRLGEHLAQQRDQLRRRTERLAEQVRDKRTSAAELVQSAERELAASGFGEACVRAGQEVTQSCDESGAPGTDAASRSPDAVVIHIAQPGAGPPGSGEVSWPDSGPTHEELALRLDQVRAGGLRDAVGSAAEVTENADAASAAVVRAEEQGRQLQELEKLHHWRDELEATAGQSREHAQALEADAAAQPLLPLIEGRDRLAVDLADQEDALAAAADARDSALRNCRDHLAGAPVGNDPTSASALAEAARRAAADFDLLAERAARAVELDSEVTVWMESLERLGSEVAEVARAGEIAEAGRAGLLAEAKDLRATVERLEPLRSNAEGLRKLRDDLGKLRGLHEEHRRTTTSFESLEADLEAARSQAERLGAELAPARQLVDTGDDLSEALGAAKQLVEVSRERDRLLSLRQEAIRKAEEQEALVERCFEAYVSATAPRLAEELVAGQPCMVCGSTDHPAPADAGEGRVVDAADLERVRSDARRSAAERERLTDQVKVLISSHPGLAGASTEELSSRVSEVEERCRRREDAIAEAGRLTEALEEAQQAVESMEVGLAARRERLSELNGAIAQATDALGESAARDVEELAGELAAAEKSVLEAEAAVGRLGEIDRALVELDGELEALEQRGSSIELRRARVEEDIQRNRRECEQISTEVAEAAGDAEPSELAAALRGLAFQCDRVRDAARDAALRREELRRAESELRMSLEGSTFADEAAVLSALLEADSRSAILRSLAERSRRESILADRMPQLEALGLPAESPDSEALASAAEAARRSARAAADLVSGISDRLDSADAFLRAAARLEAEGGPEHHELLELEEMVGVLEGRRTTSKVSLEDWVLSCYLRDVVSAANAHLAGMTGGRYELAVDSSHVPGGARAGLDLVVIDADTGRSRPTRSLSGGETFKASLALALGMADVLTAGAGGIRVDSLFVDEGFGSLDSNSVDTVIEVLDALRGRGTMVGLISHVEAMQEALPVAVRVKVRDDRRGSVVEQPDVEQGELAALSLV